MFIVPICICWVQFCCGCAKEINWFWRGDCGFKLELGPADGTATFSVPCDQLPAEQRVVVETCHLKALNTLLFVHLLSP